MSLTSGLFKLSNAFSMIKMRPLQKWLYPGEPDVGKRATQGGSQSFVCNHFHRGFASATLDPCWKCGQPERQSNFFCKNCNALQKPPSKHNLFHLLGVDMSFQIDSRELSKSFRQLQALLHPDKFSNATEDEKRFSADLSSQVNKAFRTLSDPLERGLYLLNLHGMPLLEENSSQDKAFLLEIMELNEELESISSEDELNEFHSRNKKTLALIIKNVSESFAIKDIDSARTALIKMKYFVTLENKIKEKMLELGAL